MEFAPTIVRIEAYIVVSRQAHRGIVLGKNGSKIKEIGMEARQNLELHFQNKVYLGLEVIVDEDWVNDPISIADYAELDPKDDE
jgi:GTP-binding protein Era